MAVRATVRFHGRVQGVYFRAHCAEKAEERAKVLQIVLDNVALLGGKS